ncbi:hypothetical protein PC129_g16748 [Phytophthora cactorum]|uniref:Uncharacterized protein n=1 Tax=Phytophthora cactorum TaxID=29920 RepID=A0A329R8A7_9STRA|nr:hypothetical protein Pcac1_g11462 [Phytophthora cactorum]KAG2830110.1 hypothetical protein PC112_g7819 [Phytophthora cactorum]KAG2830854.1 hypothetical protein PC111_g7199 [Phytophthora cactorum]KAG2860434.1 hypothetical protein PC113_g8051 [Phytophthora cactorum]KAG2914831.1 hypothetical protein PC114_g8011 [Phytophthora cactorum]
MSSRKLRSPLTLARVTTFITTFKLNADITQLSRYTYGRVLGKVSLGETLCLGEAVRTRSSKSELRKEYPPP